MRMVGQPRQVWVEQFQERAISQLRAGRVPRLEKIVEANAGSPKLLNERSHDLVAKVVRHVRRVERRVPGRPIRGGTHRKGAQTVWAVRDSSILVRQLTWYRPDHASV